MAAQLTDDNTLTLLLADFGVRQGQLVLDEPGGPRVEMKTLVQPRELVSPRSWWSWWIFIDGQRGWMCANHHHLGGGSLFETEDRGASWRVLARKSSR